MLFDQRFDQPDGDLQILALGSEGWGGERYHGRPIGDFDLAHPITSLQGIIGPAGILNRVVGPIIPNTLSCWILPGNGSEEFCNIESRWRWHSPLSSHASNTVPYSTTFPERIRYLVLQECLCLDQR